MPRTRQPKAVKEVLETSNASDSSSVSCTSKVLTKAELTRQMKDFDKNLDAYDAYVKNTLKEMRSKIQMKKVEGKNLARLLTMGEQIDLFLSIQEKDVRTVIEMADGKIPYPSQDTAVPPSIVFSTLGSSSGVSSMSSAPSTASRQHLSSATKYKGREFKGPASVRRSRSAVKPSHSSSSVKKRRSMSVPSISRNNPYSCGVFKTPMITPKVNPNATTSVLRLPRTGESLFSITGSPVMPNALASSTTAPQTLIPLRDGRMLSILPGDFSVNDQRMDFSPEMKKNLLSLTQRLASLMEEE